MAGAETSIVLWLLMGAALLLTYWECRERGSRTKVMVWWMLFVFTLAHVIGYLILRFFIKPPDGSRS